MPNPTQMVNSYSKKWDDTKKKMLFPQVADSYYPNEMIGRRVSDSLAYHFDDSVPMFFQGFFEGPQWKPTTDLPATGFVREVNRPSEFSMPLASGTASRVTDLNKPVYAVTSGTVTLDPLSTTNANLVGYVSDVVVSDPAILTGSNVFIRPAYWGAGHFTSLAMMLAPATGGATYGVEVLNKTIKVPNTAAETLTLPAVSLTAANDRITFVKTTSAAFSVTITPNGTDTINGTNTSIVIPAVQYARLELVSDGTQWIVFGITNGSNGLLTIPPGSTPQALVTGNTITLPSGSSKLLSAAAAVTGAILTPGTTDGQILSLINTSANSITFAASGTSNVADGTSAVIAANTRMILEWSATQSLWYHGN